jgi:hypothetical protein
MISGKLIHLIELNGQQVMTRVIAQIHRESQMPHYRAQLEPELRDRGHALLENLGYWLSTANEEELGRRFEQLGRQRFEEGVPLHETVRALCIIREVLLDFVEEHVTSKTSLELYAEEELDRRLGRFFDLLIIHTVVGYERALRNSLTTHA